MSLVYKESTRLSPKVSLNLRDRCLDEVTLMLVKTANRRQWATIRNSREKKDVREYFSRNLPQTLRQDILQKAGELFQGVDSILNLWDLFDPAQDAKDKVDLVGTCGLRIGCSRAGRSLWFIRSLKDRNLTIYQLDRLYNILILANPAELQELALSASRDALKSSKIPNILARGRALTKVTLLEGADNHIMRILGIHCPRLKYLDVSHSPHVTPQGLLNLILSRPPRRKECVLYYRTEYGVFDHNELPILFWRGYGDLSSYQKNPCAETIASVKFVSTPLEVNWCNAIWKLLENLYLVRSRFDPIGRILRILEPEGLWEKEIPFNPATRRFSPCTGLNDQAITDVSRITEVMLRPWLDAGVRIPMVLDNLILPVRKPADGQTSLLFLHHPNTFSLSTHMKVHCGQMVTTLVTHSAYVLELTMDFVGLNLPHLKHFKGSIEGVWSLDVPFLPELEVLNVWCYSSATVLSILHHAPSIQLCEFKDLQWEDIPHETMKLTDATLEACIRMNEKLAASLEEIIFSPCRLTRTSLRTLIRNCPKLKIIGDVQSWTIRSSEIKSFNRYLDRIGSQCVLSIMNLPQPRIQNFHWY